MTLLPFIFRYLRYFSNTIYLHKEGINANTDNRQHSAVFSELSNFSEVAQMTELELGIHRVGNCKIHPTKQKCV